MSKINIQVKKKFLRKHWVLTCHVDSYNKDEVDSIELSLLALLANVKAFDFDAEEEEECEEVDKKQSFGFSGLVDSVGYNDGHEPFEDEYEDEEGDN